MKKKSLKVTITLVGDTFDGENNRIVAEGLRTLVTCNYGNGSIMPNAEIVIYGLRLDYMHKLMRVRWQDMTSLQNMIRVEADGHVVYEGNITFAYIDTSTAPDIALRVRSLVSVLDIYKPVTPTAFAGERPVVQAINELCNSMEYQFTNNGVPDTLMMTDTTMVDTQINKVRKLCRDYQIDLYIEDRHVTIAPQGSPRDLPIPQVTPANGLLGYPVPTMQGIDFRSLYRPDIRFGGIVRIADSLMETCNGDWRVFGVTLSLESEMQGGNWHMDIKATFNEANNFAISK